MSKDIFGEGKKDKKPKRTSPKFRITQKHRRQLIFYLNEFYSRYPAEKFTVFHFVKYFKARLKNNKDAWMGVSGETGCQPAGSKVLMADGTFKNIEDIKVGDLVLSPQEGGQYIYAPVLKTYKWDSHTNYKIVEGTRKNQELFECSHNHELPTYKYLPKSSRWALKYYTAEAYSKLSNTTITHRINKSAFPIPGFLYRDDCRIDPYSLGVFIGDGCYKKYKTAQLLITSADKDVMDRVETVYPTMSIKDKFINGLGRNSKAQSYCYSNKSKFASLLKEYNYLNKGSVDKFICMEALLSSLQYRKQLLAGLLDSDGHSLGNMQYEYTTKSKHLAENILFLAHSVGGRASCSLSTKSIKKTGFVGEYYRLYINVRHLNIPTTKNNSVHLARVSKPNRYSIKAIPCEGTTVYGFTLGSESSWYLNDKMIILKNSGKSLLVLMSMILFGRAMNLEDNVTYIPTGDEIVDKFNKLSFNCLLVDEAAKDMRSINWQKKSQQGVTTKAQTDRFKNNWIFLNMPNFNEFTKSLKQTSIKFRAVVLYRTKTHARVIIHMKARNWRDDDPWSDKIANERYKNAQRRNREITNEVMLDIERTLANTVMDFLIPNLELILPDVTEEYEKLKIESRLNEDEDPVMSAKRNIWKEKYEETLATIAKTLYHNDMNLGKMSPTKTEIANKLKISTATLNKYIDMDINRFEKSRGME